MGNEINKTGTGKIAIIPFNTKQSFMKRCLNTDASELVDEDDVDIQILTRVPLRQNQLGLIIEP